MARHSKTRHKDGSRFAASRGCAAAWTVAPAYWPEKDWPRTVTFGLLAETVAEAVSVSPTAEALVKPHNARFCDRDEP